MSGGTTIHGAVVRENRRALAMHPNHAGVHVFSEGAKIASGAVDSYDTFAVDVGKVTGRVTVHVDIHGAVPVEVDIAAGVSEVHIDIPVNGISTHNA